MEDWPFATLLGVACDNLGRRGVYLAYVTDDVDAPVTVGGKLVLLREPGLVSILLAMADNPRHAGLTAPDKLEHTKPVHILNPALAIRYLAFARRDPAAVILDLINIGLDCVAATGGGAAFPDRARLGELADYTTFHRDLTKFFMKNDRLEFVLALVRMIGWIAERSVVWSGKDPAKFRAWLTELRGDRPGGRSHRKRGR